ncbi:serine/threonine-protein kinase PknD [Mycobacterium sp.]|uniref:serine/threonine-protein kinase PknD n=1 Tax=Mycobacterium sp. TaxID=1785 RepID=UPI003A89B725
MTNTQPEPRVGSRFGPYQLVRLIGRGGMGEVYEAEDTRKHRVVALKLISPAYSDNQLFRTRMQREADTAGRLTEPHIVPLHDYGEIDGQFYVDMRLIDGVSLRSMLTQFGPLAPARAVAITRQVAAALDAAHTHSVTHRDVKPENILIARNDFAYLVDFGIARAAQDPDVTQAGMVVGTYNYMAPERFTGDEVTYRADIYALACVLGECLIGAPPYRGESVERLIASHLMEPIPKPSVLRPGQVPEALDQVIAKGMAKNPNDRYLTAGDLAAAASAALTEPERRQEATILRQGDNQALIAPGQPASHTGQPYNSSDETVARPIPPIPRASATGPGADSGQWTQAAPVPAAPATPAAPAPVPPAAWAHQSEGAAPAAKSNKSDKSNKSKMIAAAAAAALLAIAAVTAYLIFKPGRGDGAQSTDGQQVLAFKGLTFRFAPGGVAVDPGGTVYVTNQTMYGRVVALSEGSSSPTVKPFNGLYEPQGIAVDAAGKIYVSDFNNRVVALSPGSNNQVELPFQGLDYPEGVAVDAQGNVYVADRGNNRVLKLAPGSSTQTEVPFTGLKNPDGVALDAIGNIYVTDTDNNRVLKLDAGTTNQTQLPFTGIAAPWGITVDNAGNIYVTEHDDNKVLKLPADGSTAVELPFTGLNTPLSVAVNSKGTIYVADRGNGRVVKLQQPNGTR